MIVLDTNVVPEPIGPQPAPALLKWLSNQPVDQMAITAITVAEIHAEIATMPIGRRRQFLYSNAVETTYAFKNKSRILAFDDLAALEYARIVATRRRIGRPIQPQDATIAAICVLHGATLATRNVRDFAETSIAVVNSWASDADQGRNSGMR